MEGFVECLSELEWLLEQTLCELGIMGTDIVYADYQSSLVFLEHQNDL